MFCLIQDSLVKEWLLLGRLKPNTKHKNDWIPDIVRSRIPYEVEDIRFKRSTLYLQQGYNFYRKESDILRGRVVKIEVEIIDKIYSELVNNNLDDCLFTDEDKISLREFFLAKYSEINPQIPDRVPEKKLSATERRALVLKQLAAKSTKILRIL
jgi:hypothetical protein